MDAKNFVLTYYKNAAEGMHIQKLQKSTEAQKPHTHEYFQIYFIIKGALTHFAEGDFSKLSKGDMFIIPPGKVHYIREEGESEFYSFSFMPNVLMEGEGNQNISRSFLKSLMEGEKVRAKVTLPHDEVLFTENLMEQIYREFSSSKIGRGEIIRSCASAVISIFARNYYEKIPGELSVSDNRELMLYCIEYMKNNFAENISLDEMARKSAMSKSSFCKIFFELTGTTFNKFLNSCRIRAAEKYINEGYKITGIYGLCGYNDFSTFYRNFKKYSGVSPRKYRGMQKSQDRKN